MISVIHRLNNASVLGAAKVLGLLSFALLIGCDHEPDNLKPGAPISITILSGGKPVPAGQVDLSGEGGGSTLDAQGVAAFSHVPYGTYQVIVLPPELDPVPPEPGVTATPAAPPIKFPPQYGNEKTTPLSITVSEAGENNFTLEIQ